MKNKTLATLLAISVITTAVVADGIPEPDMILYGQVCMNGSSVPDQNDVTVIATTIIDNSTVEVGRYKMGDLATATDCDGTADCYVLRIRLESVPSGETGSGKAVVLNSGNPASVQLSIKEGLNPEIPFTSVVVDDRAIIRMLHIRDRVPSADLNGDGNSDLLDHQQFLPSFQGPATTLPNSCDPADINGDGHGDLADFAIIQSGIS